MGLLAPSLPEGEHFGVLAELRSPQALVDACEQVRDAGYTRWDAHTPFPIHGLDRAMGLRRSRLPFVVLALGLTGAAAALLMQWWMSVVDYPIVYSGKPYFSWPAFIPIVFELGVLFAAFAAVFGMFGFNQLPMLFHPLFHADRFARASDDGFFISIESWDPRFDPHRTAEFLRGLGATHVELVPRRV